MVTATSRLHNFVNDLLIANYHAQRNGAGMLTDLELEEAVASFFPGHSSLPPRVYREYFNGQLHGFGLGTATETLYEAYASQREVVSRN